MSFGSKNYSSLSQNQYRHLSHMNCFQDMFGVFRILESGKNRFYRWKKIQIIEFWTIVCKTRVKKPRLTWTCQLSLAKSHLSPFSSVLVLSSRKNNLFFSYRKWCHDRRNKFDDLLDLFHPLKPGEDFPFSFSIMHITHLIAQGHTVTGCLIS